MNIGSLPPAVTSQCIAPSLSQFSKAPPLSSGVAELFQTGGGVQHQALTSMPAPMGGGLLFAPLSYLSQAVSSLASTLQGLTQGLSFGSGTQGVGTPGFIAGTPTVESGFSFSNLLGSLAGGSWIDVASGLIGNLFQQVDFGNMLGSIGGGVKNFFNKLF